MLRAKLLGTPQVSLNDHPLSTILTGRGLALFAYLAASREPRPRTILADLLWTNLSEQQAKERLRTLLYTLHQTLGDYLLVTRQAVALNRQFPYWLDVEVFAGIAPDQASRDPLLLAEVLNLYQHDYLNGFYIENAPIFETWLIEQRQHLRNQALTRWQQLVSYYWKEQQYEAGIAANRRRLDLEPWNEEAHLQQMRFFIATGQRSAALSQYELCCQRLREELDAPPSAEIVILYQQIKTQSSAVALHISAPEVIPVLARTTLRVDWGTMPTPRHFLGRRRELAALQQWIVAERCRAVAIVGMGGQGKTALAAQFVQTLTTATLPAATTPVFEGIIWRSLLHAPPLTDILQDWLTQLSGQQIITLPRTLDGQFALLAEHLQRRRFLLVLDNVESIVVAAAASKGEEYAAYGQLWQLFLQREHQCCLLITGRESLYPLHSLSEKPDVFRHLGLDGLTTAEGEQLLKSHGLQENNAAFSDLHQRYSGNPLALTLVAQAIDELFAGDVRAFLQEESLFLGDIDAVLDQQFNHLSPLEQELLTWLALEQEPISSQQLWNNLVAPPAKRDHLSALRTLLHRSLIQQQGSSFGVQNVILEYARNRLIEEIYQELTDDKMTGWQEDRETRRQGDKETRRQTLPLSPSPLLPCSLSAHSITLSKLNRYALSKAQSKDHIRAGQERLLLAPLLQRLLQYWGQDGLAKLVQRLLVALRQAQTMGAPLPDGYAASNLLHLLLQCSATVSGYDFSALTLRQAYLRQVQLHDCNLTGTAFHDCAFTDAFAAVTAVLFHPTGEWLAVGTYHGDIRFWRLGDNQFYDIITVHTYPITRLAISPDGSLLASGSIDDKVYLWDVAKRKVHHVLPKTVYYVRGLTFSRDGQWLVVPAAAGIVNFYAVVSGALEHSVHSPSEQIWAVAFSPTGKWLAGGSAEGTIYLWQVDRLPAAVAPSPWQSLRGHTAAVETLIFSADGQTLYSGGRDHMIYLWDLWALATDRPPPAEPRLSLSGHRFYVRSLALSPTGQYLASGGADGTVRLWDAHSGQLLDPLVGHDQWVWDVAFQPSLPAAREMGTADLLVSVGDDQRIITWEIEGQVHDWAQPEGTRPALHGRLRQVLQGYTDDIFGLVFTPDGKMLISAGLDKQIRVWDVETGMLHALLRSHSRWIYYLTISPNGQAIAWGDADGKVWLYFLTTMLDDSHPKYAQQPLLLEKHTFPVFTLAFSPDGQLLASGGIDQTVCLWDVHSGKLLQTLTDHTGWVWALTFSPDGQTLASASNDHTIRLWDVSTLANQRAPDVQLRQILHGRHVGANGYLAFSADGERLVSASADQTIRIWDRAGQISQVLSGHTQNVQAVALSPCVVEGQLTLASYDEDHYLRIWDVDKGEVIQSRLEPGGTLRRLTYSPNGKILAGANRNGYIHLWDGQSGAMIKTLQIRKPYAGMEISNVTGITPAQKAALHALGAVEGEGMTG